MKFTPFQYKIEYRLTSKLITNVPLSPTGPSGSGAAEARAAARSPAKTVIVRAVSHSTSLGDFFFNKI